MLRPFDDGRTARDRLETADASALAEWPVRFRDHVTDVSGVAARPVNQPTTEHQTATHAGGHDHAEEVVVATSGSAPMLTDGEAHRVVVHVDGHIGKPLA